MIRKVEIEKDVVRMARIRIRNVFSNGIPVYLSTSGGKDSICLFDLVMSMVESGEVDGRLLTVDFVDEEAIYPCVERIVYGMQKRARMNGIRFRWWCCEFKHFNCFNQLAEDESFITWDRRAVGRWVRKRPRGAIVSHGRLKKGVDTYQKFLKRINADGIQICGVRVAESIQRMQAIASRKSKGGMEYPIYDWRDTDVWRYIGDHGLDFPDAYLFMYQTGRSKQLLRISQFFSVDTAQSLVQMCEYYPDLFDRICRREPNAYLAMLYFDSEFFRRKREKQNDAPVDYKAKTLAELQKTPTKGNKESHERIRKCVLTRGAIMNQKNWRDAYNTLVGGDPKGRSYRSLVTNIFRDNAKGASK